MKSLAFTILLSVSDISPNRVKDKGNSYSIAERRVPELIPVPGSQPAGDVNHKPGGIGCHYFPPGQHYTLATFTRAATNFAAG